MSVRTAALVILAVALLASAADPAWARQGPSGMIEFEVTGTDVERAAGRTRWFDCCELPCWDFDVAIPIWIPGVTGTFADGGLEVDGDGGIGDAASDAVSQLFEGATDLQYAFVGALGVRHGRWRVVIDGVGANLGAQVNFTLTDDTVVDGELGALILRGRLAYEFARRPFCLFGRTSCFTAAAYGGLRYYYVGFQFDLPLGINVDRNKGWFDPLVGVNLELQWGRWGLRVQSDLGGFGLNSDFSVWLSGELEYRFNHWFSILGGYSLLDVDFSEGAGINRFGWNLTLSGPTVGLRFRF